MSKQHHRSYNKLKQIGMAVLAFVIFVIAWQLVVSIANFPAFLLPSPYSVALRYAATFGSQIAALEYTATSTILGFLIAFVVGLFLALFVVYIPPIKAVLFPLLSGFNSLPKVALAPLLVIWFGLGIQPKILLAALLAVFPIFVNSITGLSEIQPEILDLAKIAGGNEMRIFLKVRLINSIPYLMDSIKIAFPLAIIGAIVGEFISGSKGIGYLILSGQYQVDTALVFGALISVTVLTFVALGITLAIEDTFLKWRPSKREK